MGVPELKNKMQMQIENADERLLRIVSSVFDNYLNENTIVETTKNCLSEPAVAYDITGKPLTSKQYNKEIDKGIDDFKNGRFVSHESLLEEIKNWRNEI
ncbi:MAG: hypothetical protein PHC28_03875 [Flavobacterium sp.]|uniref:hypothetical protein n=1 Tax=Flavobacterium sp. TaxID=239 RepID=UPI00261FA47C|nr:hypothetical protein [Flavobacterium sp.]MDD5149604.1 hypothetical protein [Flavobacterium sp.]